jgi:hypothetical protein
MRRTFLARRSSVTVPQLIAKLSEKWSDLEVDMLALSFCSEVRKVAEDHQVKYSSAHYRITRNSRNPLYARRESPLQVHAQKPPLNQIQ